jgi:hypothetical protein
MILRWECKAKACHFRYTGRENVWPPPTEILSIASILLHEEFSTILVEIDHQMTIEGGIGIIFTAKQRT